MTRRKRATTTRKDKAQLRAGITYLIEDERPLKAFRLFTNLVSNTNPGLCITRNFPSHISEDFKLKKSSIFWLTRRKGEMTIDPVQLTMISHIIQEFMAKSEKSIIILDGIEYLIIQNDFKPVLRFIQHIRDEVLIQGANLLIPLSPEALSISEVKLLERELEILIINQKPEIK
ncbi:MAG: DUF835 domain-containing protein [Candidatus Hodarchaeota archaeon]